MIDVEAVERATVAAVAPPEVLEIGGWLIPLDAGTVSRAKSAVPLSAEPDDAALDAIETAYRSRGLPPAFRIVDSVGTEAVRAALDRRGYAPERPTLFKVADAGALAGFSTAPVILEAWPDADWAEAFAAAGVEPADAAHRLRLLASPGVVYGRVLEEGRTVAVGALSFSHGWAGAHGMRTRPEARGRGHAAAILAAFGRSALAAGVGWVMLNVEEANPARSLYRKAGFRRVWAYRYWV